MKHSADPRRPFGRLVTAMVTPFQPDGAVDVEGVGGLAAHLVDTQNNDAVLVSGTAGESPTTTDAEKDVILRAAVEAVGDRAHLIAGVGTNSTRHTIELAQAAQKAGADGLLVVTPYYNKPPQAGLIAHFTAVADAVDIPILLYDIPHRTGTAIATDTLVRLAEHPRIVGVKDAKADPVATSWVMARSDLAFYSGDDALTLPHMSVGAVGVVGTSTHFIGARTKEMIEAFEAGRVTDATALHRELLPLFTGIFKTQGPILVKAGLKLLGLPAGPMRLPQVDATEEQIATLVDDAAAAGVVLEPAGAAA